MNSMVFGKVNRKIFYYATSVLLNRVLFVQCYITFLMLYNVQLLGEVITIIHPFLIVWSIIIIFNDVFISKSFFKTPYIWFLIVSIVAAGITFLLNIGHDPVRMAKFIIQNILQLFVIYPLLFEVKSNDSDLLIKIGRPVVLSSFITGLLSLILFFTFIIKVFEIDGEKFLVGFLENTYLTGIYTDSNVAALVALISILFSIFIIKDYRENKKSFWIILCKINSVVQLLYFVLANSRGAELSLLFSIFVVLNFIFVFKCIKKRKFFKAIVSIFVIALVVVACYFCYHGLQKALVSANAFVHTSFSESNNIKESLQQVEEEAQIIAHLNRKNVGSDISSGRIGIWKEAMQIYQYRWVFGVGQENRSYYAEQYNIQGMIRNGKAIHNSYIDLLVCYGLVGFLTFVAFYLAIGIKVIKSEWRGDSKSFSYYLALFGCCFIGASAFFLTTIFTYNTLMYSVLLLLTAYVVKNSKQVKG